MITTYHNISFGTQTVPEQIPVVQGDTGREIVFILTDFTIPEGATATYYVQKPSGEAVYNTATISENNIIVPLTAQSIIEVGENDMQVRVILDEDIVTSFRAILMVRPFLGIGAVESSTEINIFDQAVEDAYERITEEVVWPANFYGTCQTAAATQDKTVTVQGGFILKSGVVVNVMCAFTNSASQITLNVNNTGAKAVYYRGSKVSGDMLVANGMYTFVYANSNWNLAGLNGKLLQLDDTLTVSGKAADSKATGDRFDAVEADVTALQAELPDLTETVMSAFVVDTATGAIATFPDGADNVPVKSLSVDIDPVQDLHGQTSPYPGGGGVNKFQDVICGYTIDNTTGEFGGSQASSSTTAASEDYVEIDPTANYVLGWTNSAFASAATRTMVFFYNASKTFLSRSAGVDNNPRTLLSSDIPEGAKYIRTKVYSTGDSFTQTELTNAKFMMNSGSTLSPYAPYSNICPITGHTQAVVTRTGKNLIPALLDDLKAINTGNPWSDNAYTSASVTYTVNSDGSITINGTATGASTLYLMRNLPKTLFTNISFAISASGISSITGGMIVQVTVCNVSDDSVSDRLQVSVSTPSKTLTIDGTKYIKEVFIRMPTGAAASNVATKYQLELGSTATSYSPYQGETYTIDLDGTRYGGTLDVTSGVLTVTMGYVDLGTLTWHKTSGTTPAYDFFESDSATPIPTIAGTINAICEQYSVVDAMSTSTGPNYALRITGSKTVRIRDTSYSDETVFKTAMSGVQLVYELASPLTVQLTAEEVTTLLGTNNIFADCGDISCEYRADTKKYIDKIFNA